MASANLSSSALRLDHNYLSSDSVGSIIRVPGMGKDIVGEWNPKSMSLLATSSSLTPVYFLMPVKSTINS